jgi:hypothetical protein
MLVVEAVVSGEVVVEQTHLVVDQEVVEKVLELQQQLLQL